MWFELNSFFRKEGKILEKTLSISISFFFFSLAWNLLSPVFSIRINEITGSVFISGLFFTTWGIVRLITDVPVGVFSDRIKPVKLLRFACFFYPFIVISYALIHNVTALFILRVIHSLFGSLLWVSAWSLIRSLPQKKYVEENVGFFVILRNIPVVFGPMIAVLLLSITRIKILYFISAGLLEIMFLILFFKKDIKLKERKERKKRKILNEIKNLFKTKKVYSLPILFISTFIISSGFGSFLPIILQEEGFSIEKIGFLLSLSTIPSLIITMPASKIGDVKGRKPIIILGSIITSLGFLVFSQDSNFWIILSSLTLINIGDIITVSTINALVADLTIDGKSGSFAGITEFFKDVGQIIGPAFAGFMLKISNYHSLSYIYMVVIIISLSIIYKWL